MTENCRNDFCDQRAEACDTRFVYLEKMSCVKADAVERALSVAKEEMNRRLEGMNGFRKQLEKQTNSFVDKGYYDLEHRNLRAELDLLREWKQIQVGKSSTTNLLAAVSMLLSFIVAVLHFFPGVR